MVGKGIDYLNTSKFLLKESKTVITCLVLNIFIILVDSHWENPYKRCIENSVKHLRLKSVTAQKMKFSNKDFRTKCDPFRSFLRI